MHVALHFGLRHIGKIKESWRKKDPGREKEAAASWVVAAEAAASFVLLLRDETDERGLTDGRTD